MKFKARKSFLIKILIVFVCGLWLSGLTFLFSPVGTICFLVMFCVSSLLLWIYFGTAYEISDHYFIYKSGPVKGKIALDDIKDVKLYESWFFVGWKVALGAKNGLIIRYKKFDDIFIDPENKEQFIKALQEKKPLITVAGKEQEEKKPVRNIPAGFVMIIFP